MALLEPALLLGADRVGQERDRKLHAHAGAAEGGMGDVLGEHQHVAQARLQRDVRHLVRAQPPRPELLGGVAVAQRDVVVGSLRPARVDEAQVVAVRARHDAQAAVIRVQVVQIQRHLDVRDRPGGHAAAAVPGGVAHVRGAGRSLVHEVVPEDLAGNVQQPLVLQQRRVPFSALADMGDVPALRAVEVGELLQQEVVELLAQGCRLPAAEQPA